MNKDKAELWLFGFVAAGTGVSLVASMAHLLESFGYANNGFMAWGLAIVAVMLNGMFIAMWSITSGKSVKRSLLLGMVLLFLVEFFGNFAAGGLAARRQIPAEMSDLFLGLSRDVIIWAGTFLFAAFLPILNFISVYALSETGLKLLEKSGQVQTPNPWATAVMRRHENQPNVPNPSQPFPVNPGVTPTEQTRKSA